MASSNTTQVVSLVGRQGSGKTTIGAGIAARLNTRSVEVSQVVKVANKELADLDLARSGERTKENPDWLGDLVYECIVDVRSRQESGTVVVTGAREPEVHAYLIKKGIRLWPVTLYADPFTRFNRLMKQGRVHDIHEFLYREIAEWGLGLGDLMETSLVQINVKDSFKYTFQVAAILEKLKGFEAKL